MVVTRRELEGLLAEVTQSVKDPRAGVFGPSSMTWKVNREAVLFAGGGRALLMQLAHPAVSHAVEQHSESRTKPQERFVRTFASVFSMVFGDLASTVDAARRVHKTHASIRGRITEGGGLHKLGDTYAANTPEALVWVFATLVDSALKSYSLLVHRLTHEERERYYGEAKLFARLFGLSEEDLPSDWNAFQRYINDMVEGDSLHVTSFARDIATFFLEPPGPMWQPVMAAYRVLTAGLLPEALRKPFGLEAGPATQIAFWLEVRTLKTLLPGLPPGIRYFPAYLHAARRIEGKKGPDRVGRFIEQLVIRSIPHGAK